VGENNTVGTCWKIAELHTFDEFHSTDRMREESLALKAKYGL
jgi:hypothetical protein